MLLRHPWAHTRWLARGLSALLAGCLLLPMALQTLMALEVLLADREPSAGHP